MARPLSQKALDALGNEYLELKAAKVAAETRLKELDKTFRAQFDLGPHLAGTAKVSVQRNVRRDDAAFQASYPFEQYPDFYKPTIDTETVKRELAPAVLERFEIVGDPKIIVTAVEK